MELTKANYHSVEAERAYMSRSQYLGFLECEAQQKAILDGVWAKEKGTALLVGSYIHAWSEGTMTEFVAENPEMFTQKGKLKADFAQAEIMIEALQQDPIAMFTLQGEKEVIITAEFAGARWKVMLDVLNRARGRIVDLKSTRSIREKYWDEELRAKVSFVEQYNYPLQAALYSEIERIAAGRESWLDFLIVAVSKEKTPDKEIISLTDENRYCEELAQIEVNMPRILAVKAGIETPTRCENCSYCRSTKMLTGAIHYTEL